jgi:hypothetical protein
MFDHERTPLERETLDVPAAGRVLGLGRAAAYQAARSGKLPVLRFGRRLVVPKAALIRLLNGAGDPN